VWGSRLNHVKQIQLARGISVHELVTEMQLCGVLGAGKIGKAAEVTAEMFRDPDYTVFLTIAGALVPGGLRKIIRDLVNEGYVDVIVSTGANLVHDMVEALGHRHSIGTFAAEDKKLKAEEIGRIGDIYIEQRAFEHLEDWMFQILERIPPEKRRHMATFELLNVMGKEIHDPESILATAARRDVPIICPAFVDSIAGFHLWVFGQDKKMGLDPLLDVNRLMDKVYEAKKVGIIILGGGSPKHFALFANSFREGVDRAVQITMDRPEPGGLSGASLEEAISWSKVKPEGRSVTVICDATIAFPLIVGAVLGELGPSIGKMK
jgi:deoxyhypusine synthase